MNYRTLVISVTVALSVFSLPTKAMSTGEELYTKCKAVFIPKSELTEPEQMLGLMQCLGYVRGYADANVIYGHLLNGNTANYTSGDLQPFACGFEKAQSNELAKDVVRYIDQKPSSIEGHPAIIMMTVLEAKYPCSKTK